MPTDRPDDIVVLEEEERVQIELDPPEPGSAQLVRGLRITTVFGCLFLLVLLCAAPATAWYVWPSAEPVGGPLVVVPFVQQGSDDDAMADEITRQLVGALDEHPNLQLPSIDETLALKGDTRDIVIIGKEHGARFALQGEVRPAGDQVAVKISLVDVDRGGAIASGRYKGAGDAEGLSAMTLKIARDVRKGTGVTRAAE